MRHCLCSSGQRAWVRSPTLRGAERTFLSQLRPLQNPKDRVRFRTGRDRKRLSGRMSKGGPSSGIANPRFRAGIRRTGLSKSALTCGPLTLALRLPRVLLSGSRAPPGGQFSEHLHHVVLRDLSRRLCGSEGAGRALGRQGLGAGPAGGGGAWALAPARSRAGRAP